MMEPALLTGLPLWAINLFLAGLVFARQPRNLSNQAFAAFVLTVVGWSFSVQLLYADASAALPLWCKRLPFVAASLIGSSFAVFCTVYPDSKSLRASRGSWPFIVIGVVVAALSLTPLVVRDASPADVGGVQPHYGPLYPLFGLFTIAAFGYGFWTLTRKWWAARGRPRLQVQYLWLGLCWAIAGGTTTNLIIPALTGSSRFSAYGPYFSMILVGLTAHAIIRYRLMDIRVVVGQSVTYALSAGVAVGIIWGLFAVLDRVLGPGFEFSAPIFPLLVGLTGAVVFHPARVVFKQLFDRYCYRWEYDYRQAMKTISQVLANLLRIDPLCEHLATFILTTLKVEEVAVYLCHDQGLLERRAYRHADQVQPSMGEPIMTAPPGLMALLARAGTPIPQEELALWVEADEAGRLSDDFAAVHGKVLIPLLVGHQVAAFIAVGEKLSGDPFFTYDLEFLATIGHQAAAALKRAQLHEEVAWMQEYSESILHHMESGLVVASHDGFITVMNDAAGRMLGLTAADVVGQPIETLIASGLGLPLLDTLLGKTVYTNHEATLTPATGQPLPAVLSTSILRGLDGQPRGAILVVSDLSKVKALEEEKRRIERLASIGSFMSGIAHEIKNPLVAIKTLAELLPEQYDDPEFRETFTKVTLQEVDRIDGLVRRLRSLSSGSTAPLRPLNVIAPLEETLALISGELTRRHVNVVRLYQPSVPPIMGDHDQLKQVFVNLCLNALEAMGEGGTLTVTVESHPKHAGPPSEVSISIADTGPGIPAAHLAHIFDPFFTLKAEGTGLGLAICRGILDHHRGSIVAANGPEGSGAIFTLTVPVAQGVDAYESPATCG
jgi:two-component system NtrC family sensor kinase